MDIVSATTAIIIIIIIIIIIAVHDAFEPQERWSSCPSVRAC